MFITKQIKNISFKRSVFLLAVIVFLLLSLPSFAAIYNASDIVMTPGSDMSKLNFNWYSDSNTNSVVQVALKSDMTGSTFPVNSAVTYVCITASSVAGHYSNKAVVNSLSVSTEYVYRLGDGNGNWTENYFFTTSSATSFSFFAVGDPQIGAGGTASDTDGWCDTVSKAYAMFPQTAFLMSAGDQVDTNINEDHFTGFFTPAELKSLPVAPALGNHDAWAANTSYHYNLPNQSDQYGVTQPTFGDYYYTYGNAVFIILNTNNMSGATHEAFIKNTIEANPDKKWKIVMFHHDIYGSGYHASEVQVVELRNALFPVFDEYGIDIVINGHDHSYTRSYVMYGDNPQLSQSYDENGAVINPNGTVYYTLNSASGSKLYGFYGDQADYVAVRSQLYVPTFSHVSIDGDSLSFITYRTDTMTAVDTFSIVKDGKPGDYTFEKRIISDIDDVEENETDGTVYADSSDLEMVYDGYVSSDQIIGLRYDGVSVPKGAVITNAYIQFTCDEVSTGTVDLTIKTQASDNAPAFAAVAHNVTSRTTAAASVNWSPPEWLTEGESGISQRTPDLKDVVQEIIDRTGWTEGNALVFIITGSDWGRRCAESFAGSNEEAPLLHIEYKISSGNTFETRINSDADDVEEKKLDGTMYLDSSDLEMVYDAWVDGDQLVGLRFNNVSVPKGAVITNAYIQFTCDEESTGYAGLVINAQASDNAPAFTATAYNVSSRPTTSASVSWLPPDWTTEGESGLAQRTPDLKGVVQEIVNRSGWTDGNALAFIITGSDWSRRCAESFAGSSSAAPLLHIEYKVSSINTFETQISSDIDDVEEKELDGTMYTNSSDLEMVYDAWVDGDQLVGLRFNNVSIPKDAVIINAYIQFTCDEESTGYSHIVINAHDTDNAPAFSTAAYDVSSRPTTSSTINWYASEWLTVGESGPDQRTPDLTYIVQEIVDRSGWTDGNALAFIIKGADWSRRCAVSYAGSSTEAPLLHIEYSVAAANTIETQISSDLDDVEEKETDGSMYLNSSDLEMVFDWYVDGDQIIGLRFNNISVPKGAVITNAYIQFTCDEVGTGYAHLDINAQASDNAPAFTASAYNVTSRAATSASVHWLVPEWLIEGESDFAQRTPDLKGVVQEVVSRSGWTVGNSLAFIITGSDWGHRCAESYSGSNTAAPILHIEYIY